MYVFIFSFAFVTSVFLPLLQSDMRAYKIADPVFFVFPLIKKYLYWKIYIALLSIPLRCEHGNLFQNIGFRGRAVQSSADNNNFNLRLINLVGHKFIHSTNNDKLLKMSKVNACLKNEPLYGDQMRERSKVQTH